MAALIYIATATKKKIGRTRQYLHTSGSVEITLQTKLQVHNHFCTFSERRVDDDIHIWTVGRVDCLSQRRRITTVLLWSSRRLVLRFYVCVSFACVCLHQKPTHTHDDYVWLIFEYRYVDVCECVQRYNIHTLNKQKCTKRNSEQALSIEFEPHQRDVFNSAIYMYKNCMQIQSGPYYYSISKLYFLYFIFLSLLFKKSERNT